MKHQNHSQTISVLPHQNQLTTCRNQRIRKIRGSIQQLTILNQNESIRNRYQQPRESLSETVVRQDSSSQYQHNQRKLRGFDVLQQKYKILEKLGEGTNGCVYQCIKKRTGKAFAVKQFKIEEEQLPETLNNFKLVSSLNHPNIVRHRALYVDLSRRTGWLVMDLAEGDTLDQAKIQGEGDLKKVTLQLLKVLEYFQSKALVHRDIKPENIIYNPRTKQIKVVDFGISKELRRGNQLWTNTGTLFYKAPEMFEGTYTASIDMWAAGVLLFFLICGKTPFESQYQKQVINNIRRVRFQFPSQFDNHSEQLKLLLESILQKNVQERPTPQQCMEDPWFSDFVDFNPQNCSEQKEEIPEVRSDQANKKMFSSTGRAELSSSPLSFLKTSEIYIEDSDWSEDV